MTDKDFEEYNNSPLIPLDLDDDEDFSGNEIIPITEDDYTFRICPKCGKEYGEEYKYPRCRKDGGELFMLWKCRHCGEDFSKVQGYTSINVCPNCGEKLDPKQKEAINKGRSSETNVLKRICTKCQEIFDEEFECCGMCGNITIPMQCACGENFRQKEDGGFDKYCPVCGKPNPIEQEKQRKAAEEALKKKKEEQERIKQQEEERKKAEARRIAEEKERQHSEWINSLKNGDTIEFGSYPFEADGTKKTVEWRILEKKADGTALVISKYGLDARRFDASSNNWERSEIRQWLNNEFYNATFKDEEKNAIIENSEAGSKVFLLSKDEAGKYFKNDNDRKACLTPYAKGRGAYTNANSGGSCWWWLRSPGYDQNFAANVYPDGDVYSHGYYVYSAYNAVRVALKINLKNL